MSWAGGTYTKGNNVSGGWVGDASVGIGIEAGRHDTQDNDFATGINTCLTKDGQNAATADLPMGGFKHTNVATATARNNYAAVSQVQDGDFIWLGTTGGTATAMTASATPAITAYKAGQKFRMLTGTASTGTNVTGHSLNVNGLGAKSVKTSQGSIDPTVGDWLVGSVLELIYTGSTFVIINAAGAWATWSATLTPQAGTASSVVFDPATYQKFSRICHVQCYVTWTQNTASASYIDIRLPIDGFYNFQNLSAFGQSAGNVVSAFCYIATSGTVLRIYNYNQAAFLTGANQINFGGTYMTA
jgi:hypothetical protein